MNKTISLKKQKFETSCGRTPQYLTWHRTFKREFTAFLTKHGATEIAISKPNHFDATGFFRAKNGTIYYVSVSDLRFFPDNSMLIRTAQSFKDYTGGRNQSVSFKDTASFEKDFLAVTA